MKRTMQLENFALEFLQTAFRLFPWPTEVGLRAIGHPDASSPVLLTGNYDLTVRRLMQALEGIDAWLLVAPSGGINVWCASSGGHLSTHQVVTVLKASGIADKVNHRTVILPQLAATGVLGLDVFRRSRWKVRFGPVDMHDLPEYLGKNEKTDAMRRVDFPLRARLEMALMWAAPTTLLVSGLAFMLAPAWALPIAMLIASMSVAVFTVYDRLGEWRSWILPAVSTVAAFAATWTAGGEGAALAASLLLPLLLTGLLTFDHAGSTPLEGGSHFAEREWRITLDEAACEGVFRCWEVCPEACFEKREAERKVVLAHDDRCIRCGACVVQCPKDALFLMAPGGERIEPAVIRRFKLNLLGDRKVDSG